MSSKKLYIVRHAKSSWAEPDQSDFSRPLNDRGRKDAPFMANKLMVLKDQVDRLISSPALRAKQTAELFCEEWSLPKSSIQYEEQLYHAPSSVIHHVLSSIPDTLNTVVVFCHNPGITDFANGLMDDLYIDNVPTCGILGIEAHTEKWGDFKTSGKRFLGFYFPKQG